METFEDPQFTAQMQGLASVRIADDSILGIDHVAIAVVDLVKAIDWYRRTLGFQVIGTRRVQGRNTAMLSAVLVAGSAVIVLVQGTTPESQVSRFIDKFGAGVQHVAFGVRDIDAAMRDVASVGSVADTPILSDTGIRQVFLHRDAESAVRVELIERRGGDFSDSSVARLFRAFEAGDLY